MSVNLVVNKAPVAVGTAALSSEDMYMSGKDLYKVEETLEKLREFSIVRADRTVLAALEISGIWLKYPTFEGCFYSQKKFLHIVVASPLKS